VFFDLFGRVLVRYPGAVARPLHLSVAAAALGWAATGPRGLGGSARAWARALGASLASLLLPLLAAAALAALLSQARPAPRSSEWLKGPAPRSSEWLKGPAPRASGSLSLNAFVSSRRAGGGGGISDGARAGGAASLTARGRGARHL
jgi:hypothetical protein